MRQFGALVCHSADIRPPVTSLVTCFCLILFWLHWVFIAAQELSYYCDPRASYCGVWAPEPGVWAQQFRLRLSSCDAWAH